MTLICSFFSGWFVLFMTLSNTDSYFCPFRRICFVPHLFWSGTSWDETMQITIWEGWTSLHLSFIIFSCFVSPLKRFSLGALSTQRISFTCAYSDLPYRAAWWLYSCILEVAFTCKTFLFQTTCDCRCSRPLISAVAADHIITDCQSKLKCQTKTLHWTHRCRVGVIFHFVLTSNHLDNWECTQGEH